jgi:hypothetical protein
MDADKLAQSVLCGWRDAIGARDLEAIEQLFAENAIFIATAPAPLLGRAAIRAYYAAAPAGLSVAFELIACAAQPSGFGFVADVSFVVPQQGALRGRLSFSCTQQGLITLYHLSLTPARS